MSLTTGNMSLRKLEPQDIPLMYLWENDSRSWQDGAVHNPLSQKDLRDYLSCTTGDIYKDGQLRLIISSNQQSVGCIDLYDFDPFNRKAGIGIYIDEAYRKSGYATKAIEQVVDYAFNMLDLSMLYAFVAESNTSSIRLFSKCGFKQTATLSRWTKRGDVLVFQLINR